MADFKMPIAIVIALVVVGIIVAGGLIIGHYVVGMKPKRLFVTPDEFEKEVTRLIMKHIDPKSIADYARVLKTFDSPNGNRDFEEAKWVRQHFEDQSLDKVSLYSYDVLLSHPDQNNSNYIYLLDSKGDIQYQSVTDSSRNYIPYRADHVVEGEVVYAHYGREEDLIYLQKTGIDIKDKILLLRCTLTTSFVEEIVQHAHMRQVRGILFYPDPKDFQNSGNITDLDLITCEDSLHFPPGDPLTPNGPSVASAYRIKIDKVGMPNIPVQSIHSEDALHVFKSMKSENKSPNGWRGLLNSNYPLGPGFKDGGSLKIQVKSQYNVTTIYNVIASLEGSMEPDRYVLLGSPRKGLSDDVTGTAILMEAARVLNLITQDEELHWRPLRTIVFCSWGGSEDGLIGSYEWIQEEGIILKDKTVGYFHVQTPVRGKELLKVSSVPLMYQSIYQAATKVQNPSAGENELGRKSIYNTWVYNMPSAESDLMPRISDIRNLHNDIVGFIHTLGIPVVDFYYGNIGDKPSPINSNITEDYEYHAAIGRMWTEVGHYVASAPLLPMLAADYVNYLEDGFEDIQKRFKNHTLQYNVSLGCLENAIAEFSEAAKYFRDAVVARVNTEERLPLRIVNDRLTQLERAFINPYRKGHYKHVIFAPSHKEESTIFPQLFESFNDGMGSEKVDVYVDRFNQQISELSYYITNAAKVLWGTLKNRLVAC